MFKITYKNGYKPLISPQRTRCKGYWRRKARKIYRTRKKYKQRGRGESVFGSLTNAYGDRLHTRLKKTTYTRCLAMIINYQIKILIRAGCEKTVYLVILVRHVQSFIKTLKYEQIYLWEYESFNEAYQNIRRFIKEVYNERYHSSIGYLPPNELKKEVILNRILY